MNAPGSDTKAPLGRFAPYAMPRYWAEYCAGDAFTRYVPAGRPVNSNAPCESVVACRGLRAPTLEITPPVICTVATTGPPETPVAGGVVPRPPAGGNVGAGISVTFAFRMGLPVSAATTRPLMTAVPVGSGRSGTT